jgi:hypothetical protein
LRLSSAPARPGFDAHLAKRVNIASLQQLL